MNEKLKKVFERIGKEKTHSDSIRRRISKTALGSLQRSFTSETNKKLKEHLYGKVEVKDLINYGSQEDYEKWFKKQLSDVAKLINKTSPESKKPYIYPGYQWGFAAKALSLYLRDIVEHSRYFDKKITETERKRIRDWLYTPLDNTVLECIRKLGIKRFPRKIKDIQFEKQFFDIQNTLEKTAQTAGVPKVWFDDIWANPDLCEKI